MARMTIDFGIDLGTTNSSIAVLKGNQVEVFKNNEGSEYTPSAVWIDKSGRLIVGQRAKQRYFDDEENSACEFKLLMGTVKEKLFTRSGRRMKPEELSAEVLKKLKADVQQRSGEEVRAAVITVPADFELPACKATERAARLAGIAWSPLLQEPVAAATAYGFQSDDDKVFWLVYDFGGGTFDAAVIHMRDGQFQVVNHGGDRNLGGKLIDWEIVNQLLVPAIIREHHLEDFQPNNRKWISAFAKLKAEAEKAKIVVSREESAEIVIDRLCDDDGGQPVCFEFEVKRADVERVAEPFILRSINTCKKALAEKRLSPENVEKVLLVGGPTLMPYLRERLADKKDGLGIPLEFSIDPLTVVARGAAMVAGRFRFEEDNTPPPAGTYKVHLDYQPIGPDAEPLLGGRVQASDGQGLSGFTIEFVNSGARTPWRSGKVTLGADGSFMTTLWAEKGSTNTFLIELCDATGSKRRTQPDQFPYTIAMTPGDPVLIHSVGVALANNETLFFLAKGTALPARRRGAPLRTVTNLRSGHAGQLVSVPLVEGENARRADRNRLVGALEIHANAIRRDLPSGSEVEVTIEIDQSRLIRTKAYVPLLDEEFEDVFTLDKGTPDPRQLQKDLERERKRLDQVRGKAEELQNLNALDALHRIERERMEHDVEAALASAQADGDAVYRARDRLLDLRSAIDEAEDAVEWPALVAQAEREVEAVRNTVTDPCFGVVEEERRLFTTLQHEIEAAKVSRDADLLQAKVQQIIRLDLTILNRQPGWWVARLDFLERIKAKMSNQQQAEEYIAQGRRAIHNNDFEALKAAVRQLDGLRPIEIDPNERWDPRRLMR